ncbi:MAG: hypothetical protein LBC78_05560 [Oscillospiraceae bacterium]|jgi:hypothetical protein|nr:hypothetical protein [Oscillospiraceae bacterium]
MSGIFIAKLRRTAPFIVLFGLAFTRFCYFGFQYFPQLDDYIQYHNLATQIGSLADFGRLFVALDLPRHRPIAGALDITLWSWLFGLSPVILTALFSAALAGAALLFKAIFVRKMRAGYLMALILTLLPLNFEGTYWLSAASRVCIGLLFSALSLYGYVRFCETGRKKYFLLYLPLQLLCFGLYEQAAVLTLALTAIFFLLYVRETRRARAALLSIALIVIYGAYIILAPSVNKYAGQTAVVTPFEDGYFSYFLPILFGQLRSVFVSGTLLISAKGFVRGIRIIASAPNFFYLPIVCALSAAAARLTLHTGDNPHSHKEKNAAITLAVGLALAIAPTAPFFFQANVWFSMRGACMSLLGLGLIFDCIVSLALRRVRARRTITGILAGMIALLCCVASVSELYDYKRTAEYDRLLSGVVIAALSDMPDTAASAAFLNVPRTYLDDQNFYYHDHIHGVTESAWALSGAVAYYYNGGGKLPAATPLSPGVMAEPWQYNSFNLAGFDRLYLILEENGAPERAVPVTLRPDGLIAGTDGTIFARIWEDNRYWYLEVYPTHHG